MLKLTCVCSARPNRVGPRDAVVRPSAIKAAKKPMVCDMRFELSFGFEALKVTAVDALIYTTFR